MNLSTDLDDIDYAIARAKEKILSIKTCRLQEREFFEENRAALCLRQKFCAQLLKRLLQKNYERSTYYSLAINELSNDDCPDYVKLMETKICQILHEDEIKTKQLYMLKKYVKSIRKSTEMAFKHELLIFEMEEHEISQRIKDFVCDMACHIVQHDSTLEKQRLRISCLKGEKLAKEARIDMFLDDGSSLLKNAFNLSITSNFDQKKFVVENISDVERQKLKVSCLKGEMLAKEASIDIFPDIYLPLSRNLSPIPSTIASPRSSIIAIF